jgi:hypothetical protein
LTLIKKETVVSEYTFDKASFPANRPLALEAKPACRMGDSTMVMRELRDEPSNDRHRSTVIDCTGDRGKMARVKLLLAM